MARKNEMRTNGTSTYREARTPSGEWVRVKTGGVQVVRTETRDSKVRGCIYRVIFTVRGSIPDICEYRNANLRTTRTVSVDHTPDHSTLTLEWNY